MGKSVLVVAALLAAVLLASTSAPASMVDFGEEELASEDALWALYEQWCGRHADRHAMPLRRVPPQHVNSCTVKKKKEQKS
jgi:hypothetical protein